MIILGLVFTACNIVALWISLSFLDKRIKTYEKFLVDALVKHTVKDQTLSAVSLLADKVKKQDELIGRIVKYLELIDVIFTDQENTINPNNSNKRWKDASDYFGDSDHFSDN